jgi:hypothetical protein
MSWQTYVDTHLVGTGMVTAACIIGHDGAVWASKDLDVKEGACGWLGCGSGWVAVGTAG